MKKILYFENTKGFGGALVSLTYFLKQLDKTKYQPVLVVSYKDPYIEQYLNFCKVYYLKHNQRFLPKGKLESLKDYLLCRLPQTLELIKIIKNENISLIHLNNGIISNLSGIIAGKLMHVPVIVHQRGKVWKSKTTVFFSKWIDAYIAISNFIKQELFSVGVNNKKITIAPEGLNLLEYNLDIDISYLKNEFGNNKDFLKIALVGCLVPWKGQKVLIKAIDKLIRQGLKVKAFIIGGTAKKDKWYERELKALVKKLSLEESVIFTGRRNDIPALLKYMDIIVHTSTEPEPFGRVIIEAMAMGKPIIATKIGAPVEIIKDGVNGFLVPPGEPNFLAKHIRKISKNKEFLKFIGKNARKQVEKNYSIKIHTKIIENLYRSILKKEKNHEVS